jgi:hypothetical protein
MSKTNLGAFIALDFKTVMPYMTKKNLIIFGFIAAFLSALSGMTAMSVGVGFMFGTLFSGYPFAIAEKSGLDTLYISLAVRRKTVVAGRFLFTILFDFCCIAYSFVCGTAGVLLGRLGGLSSDGNALPLIFILAGLLLIIQSIQMPIYFKYGYMKARYLAILPFGILGGGYSILLDSIEDSSKFDNFNNHVAQNTPLTVVICIAAIAVILSVTYVLSRRAYAKREF